MKRLLAAGSGSIYQMCKSFRNEESGRHHNPEFTMLEWYRVGFNHHDLMDEMDEFLQLVLETESAERMTYQKAFLKVLGVCPLEASMTELKAVAATLALATLLNQKRTKIPCCNCCLAWVLKPRLARRFQRLSMTSQPPRQHLLR